MKKDFMQRNTFLLSSYMKPVAFLLFIYTYLTSHTTKKNDGMINESEVK
jgi:hypothetical protein